MSPERGAALVYATSGPFSQFAFLFFFWFGLQTKLSAGNGKRESTLAISSPLAIPSAPNKCNVAHFLFSANSRFSPQAGAEAATGAACRPKCEKKTRQATF